MMWISKADWQEVQKELEILRRQVREVERQLEPFSGPVYKAIRERKCQTLGVMVNARILPHMEEISVVDAIQALAQHLGVRFDLQFEQRRAVLVPIEKVKK
jgi:uncharacterized coiled-coil DUF342 family protein